ncbi:rhamnan synthesis F family protein [Acetobacteraceae bacterium KSS8]|uniref:Rhamnan synthesis F family protein n=1 Tax=Endosaccharibacter trunci TaxID=2812733 RepID=A0ABT1W9H9_9PROT|nr:rhamnan synthesis F family protein [Acetobacteraceae bacterium KSS8]
MAWSGAGQLDEGDIERLGGLGIAVHHRPNTGHDFGAWQSLVRQGCIEGATDVLLANDSVFGPVFPLGPVLEAMERKRNDVWGMTESREGRWHLQSWFLLFRSGSFGSPSVQRIFRQPFGEMTRDQIVLHGEFGLGAAILADRLDWAARWRAPDRRLRRLLPGNPMHLDYLSVVRSGAVPFLKADLLRDNPARIGWANRWPSVLGAGPLRRDMVEEALAARPGQPHKRQSLIMRGLYAAASCDQPEATLNLVR